MNKKAQASLETLIIFGIGITFVAAVFYISSSIANDNIQVAQAKDMVEKIANSADHIYEMGIGTKDRVNVYAPQGIKLIEVRNHTIHIRLHLTTGETDVFADTKASLVGSLSKFSGPKEIELTVLNNGKVLIGKNALVCSKANIIKNLVQGGTSADQETITNVADFDVNGINTSVSGNIVDIVSVGQLKSVLTPGESDNLTINFTVPATKEVGTYSGIITVSGSNNSECSTRITVFVSPANFDTSGPEVTDITHLPSSPMENDPITIRAEASDANTGGNVVSNCNIELDYSGIWNSMSALDGAFDEVEENITYDLGTLSSGQHTVRIKCTDANGNEGAPYSYSFYVNASGTGQEDGAGPIVINMQHTPYPTTASNITVNGTATDLYTGNSTVIGCNIKLDDGTWIPLQAADGQWDSVSEDFSYSFGSLPVGNHTVYYQCTDEWGNVGLIQEDTFLVVDLDLALILDRSGSMSEYINGETNNTEVYTIGTGWNLVKTLSIPDNYTGVASLNVEFKTNSWWCTAYYYVEINGNTVASGSTYYTIYIVDTTSLDVSQYSAPYQLNLYMRGSSSYCYAYNREFSLLLPPTKMDAVKNASKLFVDLSGESTQIALVSYSTSATLDSPLLQMTSSNKQTLKSKIDQLTPGGWTCIECGLDDAVQELTSSRARNNTAKIGILLSDGQSNQGDYMAGAVNARENGITIYTIGFGADANETELTNIAMLTGGEYYYAPDEQTLIEIFNSLGRTFKGIVK